MRHSDPNFELHHCTRLPIEENGADRSTERSQHPHSSQRAEGRTERGLSIESIAAAYRETSRSHRPAPLRGSNTPSFRASSRGVTRDGGPRGNRRGHRRTSGSSVSDGLGERRSTAENPSTPEHFSPLKLQLTGIQSRHQGESSR